MIVLQTLLNDLPILAIAYDHARPGDLPDKWEMREILSISTFLGIMGVLFSFGLLYIGLEVLHLNLAQIQTFIFLKLATAGYLDIFMGRTRGFFWSLKPGWLLVMSGVITRILATAMAIFGWLMTAYYLAIGPVGLGLGDSGTPGDRSVESGALPDTKPHWNNIS